MEDLVTLIGVNQYACVWTASEDQDVVAVSLTTNCVDSGQANQKYPQYYIGSPCLHTNYLACKYNLILKKDQTILCCLLFAKSGIHFGYDIFRITNTPEVQKHSENNNSYGHRLLEKRVTIRRLEVTLRTHRNCHGALCKVPTQT